MQSTSPIGIFDSGYGGLTVFRDIRRELPQYDYIYLGDNARAPYGPRSFETIYAYTWQSVRHLFDLGCPLVVLACNTASAKALRSIQQNDLPNMDTQRRVLGVIRPTTEIVGHFTRTGEVGVLATRGTVVSGSYVIEIHKFFPELKVYQEACPMWVPLIENGEHQSEGADFFVKKHLNALLAQSLYIDTLVLGCTHYPLLLPKIRQFLPPGVRVVVQGEIVAKSLADYLVRHPQMAQQCSRGGSVTFLTTESASDFDAQATPFWGDEVHSHHVTLRD